MTEPPDGSEALALASRLCLHIHEWLAATGRYPGHEDLVEELQKYGLADIDDRIEAARALGWISPANDAGDGDDFQALVLTPEGHRVVGRLLASAPASQRVLEVPVDLTPLTPERARPPAHRTLVPLPAPDTEQTTEPFDFGSYEKPKTTDALWGGPTTTLPTFPKRDYDTLVTRFVESGDDDELDTIKWSKSLARLYARAIADKKICMRKIDFKRRLARVHGVTLSRVSGLLREIRAELRKLGLEWETTEYPESFTPSD